jgi:hypothetical protein
VREDAIAAGHRSGEDRDEGEERHLGPQIMSDVTDKYIAPSSRSKIAREVVKRPSLANRPATPWCPGRARPIDDTLIDQMSAVFFFAKVDIY